MRAGPFFAPSVAVCVGFRLGTEPDEVIQACWLLVAARRCADTRCGPV